jgi:hypothetical protein
MNLRSYLLLFLILSSCCHGFDTGHHGDMTRDALSFLGYSEDSIKLVQIFGWFVDFYSYVNFRDRISELTYLHFDSLLNSEEIEIYWKQFALNSRVAVLDVVNVNPPERYLAVLGLTLHAVQDYYTHSTWNLKFNRSSCDCFRSDTFWNNEFGVAFAPNGIDTGECGECDAKLDRGNSSSPQHGSYCDGINKDNYARESWDEAYSFGFAATLEWINAVEMWAAETNSDIVSQGRNFVASEADREQLNTEWNFAYTVSLWSDIPIPGFFANGHWKGPGSGNLDQFSVNVLSSWEYDSKYRDFMLVDRIWEPLPYLLYDFLPINDSDVPVIPQLNFTQRIVAVRITRAESNNVDVSNPDLFTKVTVNGKVFVDTTQQDEQEVNPYWRTYAFVSEQTSVVDIQIELLDEDSSGDDVLDLTDDDSRKELRFTYNLDTDELSGDVSGVHNSPETSVEVAGDDDDEGTLVFYVTTYNLGECRGNQRIVCETYTLPSFCSDSDDDDDGDVGGRYLQENMKNSCHILIPNYFVVLIICFLYSLL